jgi:hypothetical protein
VENDLTEASSATNYPVSELLNNINAIKNANRLEDARRLASGEVTPEQLQEENSLWPRSAKITILDLHEHAARIIAREAKASTD